MTSSPQDTFLQSLNRCAESPDFIPAFYQRFMCTSDEVRRRFRHTNFDVQNRMLLRSLTTIAHATAGEAAALRELKARAETHSRHRLNIAPHLYDLWREALLETVQEFDAEWNDQTSEAWRSILNHAIRLMVRHY